MVAVVFLLLLAMSICDSPDSALGDSIGLDTEPTPTADDTVILEIPEGSGADDIADLLEEAGIINSSDRFELLIRLMSVSDKLTGGRVTLEPGMTTVEIISVLTTPLPDLDEVVVTIPEGLRAPEIGLIFQEAGLFTQEEFLEALESAELPAGLATSLPAGVGREGYVFPDTYFFDPRETTAEDAVARLIATLDERFAPEMRQLAEERWGLNPHQVLTLASIVEREAKVAHERPMIARVYINRMRLEAPFQADPTVQFAVSRQPGSVEEFGYWKRPLDAADYDIDDPYNTYVHAGMPPGPIANSGLASIEAVVNAAEGTWFFFVAKNDCSGEHLFSVTFDEHVENVNANPPNPECPDF